MHNSTELVLAVNSSLSHRRTSSTKVTSLSSYADLLACESSESEEDMRVSSSDEEEENADSKYEEPP